MMLPSWIPLSRVKFSGVRHEDRGGSETTQVPYQQSTSFGRGTVKNNCYCYFHLIIITVKAVGIIED
jgi:hypothetical protein